eukprot:scaffold6860_cov297-Chaetoceros_neogracile.AAC.23
MERIVDSRRITIGGDVGEDVIATTSKDSIDPRNAAVATPPLSSQSIRNLYNIRTSESLSTPFNRNTGSNGNMFQVNAINCVVIRAMHVNNYSNSRASARFNVYKKSGPLLPGDTTDSTQWTMIGNAIDVTLLPRNEPSPLPEDAFTAIHMDAGTTVSLYVTRTDGGRIAYTIGIAVGNVAAENNDIEILEGYGNASPFGTNYSPRVWNGIIEYDACAPSVSPSNEPSVLPSDEPSVLPSDEPSVLPSDEPSVLPSDEPSVLPSDEPSMLPSDEPSVLPSDEPSVLPSDEPSVLPSDEPSVLPSDEPSVLPSDEPSVLPSDEPSVLPSDEPSVLPSDEPSVLPSDEPSVLPSDEPSVLPSDEPSMLPSDEPSVLPSDEPSVLPSDEPSVLPSDEPSVLPSDGPSVLPSDEPSVLPSDEPSVLPSTSSLPSVLPSISNAPSCVPSMSPSPTKTPKSTKDRGLKAKSAGCSGKSFPSEKSSKSKKSKKSTKSTKRRNAISFENNEKGVNVKEGASDGGTLVEFVGLEEGMN